MTVTTDTPGCILRPWRHSDESALVRHADNRKVWRNMTETFPHPYTAQDAAGWVAIANQAGPSVHLAIELQGEAIGGIGAIAGHGVEQRTAVFGYWLGQAHWGRGIATSAARAMVAHLFAETAFTRLEARVYEWNPPSMRVLEKAGFQREGLLRKSISKDGRLIDSVLYAAVRDDLALG